MRCYAFQGEFLHTKTRADREGDCHPPYPLVWRQSPACPKLDVVEFSQDEKFIIDLNIVVIIITFTNLPPRVLRPLERFLLNQ
jgi:hypothetical protein